MKAKNNKFFGKKQLRVIMTFIIAIITSYIFSFSEKFWIPLAAILAMQTPIGSTVYNGIRWLLFMIIIVTGGSWLFSHSDLIYPRIMDVIIGSVLGILANLFLFPDRPDVEFRKKMVLILTAYSEYLDALVHSIFHKKNAEEKRIQLENRLRNDFPVWVYHSGYNIFLRKGHRYFLMNVFRIALLLFSMNASTRHPWDSELKKQLEMPLQNAIARTQKIFSTMNTILELKKVEEKAEDFSDDIQVMDAILKKKIKTLELLSLSDNDIYPEAFLYDLKDLHFTVIKLIETFR